ncbi:hypothetical protein NPIL_453981 [Nephila pilipes]|uniref:Uncharacterized protein n=1 Tax=Nephila pilipes TaxID=299642 RepID=A0A8X6NMP8_NEPPI|nr:hypothetical protein NPIL_453981 [Nephila pilipes]
MAAVILLLCTRFGQKTRAFAAALPPSPCRSCRCKTAYARQRRLKYAVKLAVRTLKGRNCHGKRAPAAARMLRLAAQRMRYRCQAHQILWRQAM